MAKKGAAVCGVRDGSEHPTTRQSTDTTILDNVRKMPPHTCGVYGIEALRVFRREPAPELDEAIAAAGSLPNGSPERTIAKRSEDTRRCLEDIFFTTTALQTPYKQGTGLHTTQGTPPTAYNHPTIMKDVVNLFGLQLVTVNPPQEECRTDGLVCWFDAAVVTLPELMRDHKNTPEQVAKYIQNHGLEGVSIHNPDHYHGADWHLLQSSRCSCSGNNNSNKGGGGNTVNCEQPATNVVANVYRQLKNVSSHRELVTELDFWPLHLSSESKAKDWFCVDSMFGRTCEETYNIKANTVQVKTLGGINSEHGCLDPMHDSGGSLVSTLRTLLVFKTDFHSTGLALRTHVVYLPRSVNMGKKCTATNDCVLTRVDVQPVDSVKKEGAEPLLATSRVSVRAAPRKDITLKNLWYSASLAHQRALNTHVMGGARVVPNTVNVEYALELGTQKEMDVYSIRTTVDTPQGNVLEGGAGSQAVQRDGKATVNITMAVIRGGAGNLPPSVGEYPLAQPAVHYFTDTGAKGRVQAAVSTQLNVNNKWNVFYQSVALLEYLADSSVPLNKYISKGGMVYFCCMCVCVCAFAQQS